MDSEIVTPQDDAPFRVPVPPKRRATVRRPPSAPVIEQTIVMSEFAGIDLRRLFDEIIIEPRFR